jgi:iron complex transport system substrate-binding protein
VKSLPRLALTGLGLALVGLLAWRAGGPQPASDDQQPSPPEAARTRRLELPGGETLEVPLEPRRVVPANAAAVDLVARLVGPERVAALPEVAFEYSFLSTAPAGWEDLPRFQGYTAETVIGAQADLVVSHGWQSLETTSLLRARSIAVLVLAPPDDWQDVLEALQLCGRALGNERGAAEIAADLAARARRLEGAAPRELRRALSYTNFGSGGWVAGTGTTADIMFGLAGLTNAARQAGIEGHAALDIEKLLEIDPDWIVVQGAADGSPGPTAGYLAAQETLARLAAVRAGRVIPLPPRLFTTSSIELLRGAELLSEALRARGAAAAQR